MKKNILSIGLLVSLLAVGSLVKTANNSNSSLDVRDVLTENYTNEATGRLMKKSAVEVANNDLSNVKAQISEVTERGTRHIRFVAALDSYLYDEVAFTITANNGSETRTMVDNEVVTTAYTHIQVNDNILSASDAFGTGYSYLVAYTINNVPESAWNYKFTATVSAKAEGFNESVTKSAGRVIDQIISDESDDLSQYNVWDGVVAQRVATGLGTEEDPFVVNSGAELAFIAKQVNASDATYSTAHYKLGRNLDLNNKTWTSIGNVRTVPFKGVFDGNDNAIIGLNMTKAGETGLFGHVADAYIKNLDVTGTISSTGANNAILVGRAQPSTIENCVSRGSVSSTGSYSGGLVGTINGYVNAAGTTQTMMTVKNSVNYATVDNSGNYTGGIAASSSITTKIINCENSGDITYGNNYVGGILGLPGKQENSIIKGCYNYGNITNQNTTTRGDVGGIVGQTVIKVENCYQYEKAEINGTSMNKGTAQLYPTTHSATALLNSAISSRLPVTTNCTTDAGYVNCGICDVNGNAILTGETNVWDASVATSIANGTGTETDPYLITTGAELAFVASKINTNKDTAYASAYYKLANNIHLNNKTWTPIGVQTFPFKGHFDGNNKAIVGLSIATGSGLGLFGHVADAYISNLDLTGNITGNAANVGILIGRGQIFSVSNCTTRGSVTSTAAYVGTIAASINSYQSGVTGSQTISVIDGCRNYANVSSTVTGNAILGGIVAVHSDKVPTEVTNCTNYGSVTGAGNFVGGIMGLPRANATFTNCDNYGKITSASGATNVGGVTGAKAGTITNCNDYQ